MRDGSSPSPSPSAGPEVRDTTGIVTAWSSPAAVAGAGPQGAALPSGVTVAICTMSRPENLRRCLESVLRQTRLADQIVIVDASPDAASEDVVRALADRDGAVRWDYVRVRPPRAGLTRQRNLALELAARDLVGFFDDDVELDPACLELLEGVHRAQPAIAGSGAMVDAKEGRGSRAFWRLRRILGIVETLEPGRYTRTGMSTPWNAGETEGVRSGDWLPGCAMMWRTAIARDVGFFESFEGYGQAEDLEFSLRAGRRGRLLMVDAARVSDAHAPVGRPDGFRRGYMAIRNRWLVHRRGLPDRTRRDAWRFAYAWSADTLLLARHFLFPGRWVDTARQIAGRARAAADLVRGR